MWRRIQQAVLPELAGIAGAVFATDLEAKLMANLEGALLPSYNELAQGDPLGARPQYNDAGGPSAFAVVASRLFCAFRDNGAQWGYGRAHQTIARIWTQTDTSRRPRDLAFVCCDKPERCYYTSTARELMARIAGVAVETPMVILIDMAMTTLDAPMTTLDMVTIEEMVSEMPLRRKWNDARQSPNVPIFTFSEFPLLQKVVAEMYAGSWDATPAEALMPAFP